MFIRPEWWFFIYQEGRKVAAWVDTLDRLQYKELRPESILIFEAQPYSYSSSLYGDTPEALAAHMEHFSQQLELLLAADAWEERRRAKKAKNNVKL